LTAAEARFRNSILDKKGWGDHVDDGSPRMLATTHALLALRHDAVFTTSGESATVTKWLSEQIINKQDLPIHEVANALLVLCQYPTTATTVPTEIQLAKEVGLDRILKWATRRSDDAIGQVVSYHYCVPANGTQKNHYMFYLPDVLVARVLLLLGSPRAGRSFVLRVVEKACKNIDENDGLRNGSSQRVATVDQLDIDRLLTDFIAVADSNPDSLIPALARLVDGTSTRRVITVVTLIAIGAISGYFALSNDVALGIRVIGSVITALAIGVLATAIWAWIGG
jgi:hypothetical protein